MIRTKSRALLLAGAAAMATSCATADHPVADLVLTGGRIVTLGSEIPEAQALAVHGDRIAWVGSAAEAGKWIGPATEVIDLEGQLAIPGFIESHGHFYGLGEMRLQLDLTHAPTWDAIVAQVAAAVADAEPGAWIEGRGWHQSKWQQTPEPNVDGVPLHGSLSAVSPDNPVLLTHASGHAAFVNAKALALAGIDRTTPNPSGGEIIRSGDGAPTGLLRETAQGLVDRARGDGWDEALARRIVQIAGEESLSKGVTSFQDAGSSFPLVDLYRRMAEEGALPVRLWVMVRASNQEMASQLAAARVVGHGGGFLTVGGIKKSIDGALGAHGAWLLEPYSDLPSSTGLNTVSLAEIEGAAQLALEHGYQLCVHAIGDRANREVLDLYQRMLATVADGGARRWRIEHAQHLHPDDIPRFAELGVVAAMQGVHCTSDGPWVPTRLGDLRTEQGAYMWRALLDSGAVVANGTDAPVEDVDPIASFYASVSRHMANGETFYREQRMTRDEALRSYTLDAAYAAFEETEKGSLEVGKLADITVLSRDILTVPEDQIPGARVALVMVGGKVAYRAPSEP